MLRHESVPRGVIAKIGLIHKLLVKAGGHGHVVASRPWRPGLLKQFGDDQLLLVLHAAHSLALDRGAKVNKITY